MQQNRLRYEPGITCELVFFIMVFVVRTRQESRTIGKKCEDVQNRHYNPKR